MTDFRLRPAIRVRHSAHVLVAIDHQQQLGGANAIIKHNAAPLNDRRVNLAGPRPLSRTMHSVSP
eukprot:10422349-Lingulodinium_polyedra.AAC.1